MSFTISNFFEVANQHPNAGNFAIKTDAHSKKPVLVPLSGHFSDSSLEITDPKQDEHDRLLASFQKALEGKFGRDIAHFAMPPAQRRYLSANTITTAIKLAESQVARNQILKEEHINSKRFILRTEYAYQTRTLYRDAPNPVLQQHKAVIAGLKKYEDDVSSLSNKEKKEALQQLEQSVQALITAQDQVLRQASQKKDSLRNISTVRSHQQLAKRLLEGIVNEKISYSQ